MDGHATLPLRSDFPNQVIHFSPLYVRADVTLNALNALSAIADFGRAVNGRAKAGTDGVSAFATLCKTFCFCCASSLSTQ